MTNNCGLITIYSIKSRINRMKIPKLVIDKKLNISLFLLRNLVKKYYLVTVEYIIRKRLNCSLSINLHVPFKSLSNIN
jgi:hypothetical protein